MFDNIIEVMDLEELIIEYGEACAHAYYQQNEGCGPAVDKALAWHNQVVDELAERGFKVPRYADPA